MLIVAPLPLGVPAKNREFDASVIVGAFDRPWVTRIVEALARRAGPGQLLLGPLTLPTFERLFARARTALRLQGLPVSPHALRHAGPSHDAWKFDSPLPAIQARGRWKNVESVRRYAKPAGMLRTKAALAPLQRAEGERLLRILPRLLLQPNNC